MKICYFGNYNPEYNRNRVIKRGLEENNVKVFVCNVFFKKKKKYLNLYKKYKRIKKNNNFNYIIVGYSDLFFISIIAKIITRKPIIWDVFYSKYDKWVFDRKKCKQYSLKALFYFLSDWVNCMISEKIILDTNEHIKYFSKTFKIDKNKFIKVLVGSDDNIMRQVEEKKEGSRSKFIVHFHGKFIPLQGVKYIIGAAKILEKYKDIEFKIIGTGQEYGMIVERVKKIQAKNIKFIRDVPYVELAKHISKADICLGIFGDTFKTQRVIPNKAYESIACGKPLISADTPAMRELFENRKNILFCKHANSEDLADKILELKNNHELRCTISKQGYELFKKRCLPKQVVVDFLNKIHYE